ncbi:MAG TPA: DNA-3-methyladenine glycosylase [Bacteroidia bacterium]|jgi:DNA-3-methyladenine glycosylase II|nr:DNA-3-methyladenine glycosylase [Bacteroidia bacterium]HQF27899.1 DNA-3-methyladenine glycosylase [Bacteroidia bacterium]HQK96991.1 DNA-3-methyladenine glycosylase [Bacteroidia bacterium]
MKQDIDKAYRILRKDPIMKEVIKTTGKIDPSPGKNLYVSLMVSIVSQQLSVKAADTIYGRFEKLFPDNYPDANILLRIEDDRLRACGLSYQKAGYLKNIARFSLENTLEYKKLYRKSDDELLTYLTQIKGVGRWTAEMILMFSLNRADVMPLDDGGIQNAMKHLYKLEGKGKQLHSQMLEVSEAWKPYRSIACRHLWMWKDQ